MFDWGFESENEQHVTGDGIYLCRGKVTLLIFRADGRTVVMALRQSVVRGVGHRSDRTRRDSRKLLLCSLYSGALNYAVFADWYDVFLHI